MGKEVRFLKSVKNTDGSYSAVYGIDDFNKITSCLIGSGVAPFPSKDSYSADELNAMTEAVVSSGVSLDGLKVSLADDVISVAKGIAFFPNGATLEVDNEGVTLEHTTHTAETTYVYAAYDASLNVCDIYASDAAPVETGRYFVVKLAEISIKGVVTDKRTFARSKVATLGRNVFYTIYENTDDGDDIYVTLSKTEKTYWETSVDISQYNYLVCAFVNETNSVNRPKRHETKYCRHSVESLLVGEPIELITSISLNLYAKYESGKLSIYRTDSSSMDHLYGGTEIYLC